jgi:hypothetical protein
MLSVGLGFDTLIEIQEGNIFAEDFSLITDDFLVNNEVNIYLFYLRSHFLQENFYLKVKKFFPSMKEA